MSSVQTREKPYAAVVVSNYPFPITSGGRRRGARLLETMERAGLTPLLLIADPQQMTDDQLAVARARGWRVERYEQPPLGWRRVLSRARRLPVVPSRPLGRRLRELAGAGVALVQAEERHAAQYLTQVPPGTVPTVLSTHNVDSELFDQRAAAAQGGRERLRYRYRARKRRYLERHLARGSSAVLCVSDHDRSYFDVAGAGSRALLAPNGVDDDLFAIPPAAVAEHVLFFGQLGYRPNLEGLERFLETWPFVSAARPGARLRIAGPDPSPRLRKLAAGLDRVDVLGFVEDIAQELAASRLVVAPLWQGGGTRMKVLEAMAAGRPVVGTGVGVERIGFRPGEHGERADDPAELAAAVVALLEAPDRCARLGAQARRHAERFRWAQTLAPVENLYREYAERALGKDGVPVA